MSTSTIRRTRVSSCHEMADSPSEQSNTCDALYSSMQSALSRTWCGWQYAPMILLWTTLFYISSIASNILNKLLVDDHAASPVILSYCQFTFALIIDWIVIQQQRSTKEHHAARPTGFWKTFQVFAPLSFFIVLGRVSTYWSFGHVSLSLALTAKASEPIFNVLLAACLFGEFRPMTVNLSLIPIAAGVVLASVSEASYNHLGFFAAVTSAMAKVLQNIYTKRVMDSEHYSFFELHMWCAIASLLIMTPMALYESVSMTYNPAALKQVMPILISSNVQYLYSLSSYMLLSLVTHLSYTIANTMKRLVTITSGMIYFGSVNVRNIGGVAIAVAGVSCYNMAKLKHDRDRKSHKEHPEPASDYENEALLDEESQPLWTDPDELDDETIDRTSAVARM